MPAHKHVQHGSSMYLLNAISNVKPSASSACLPRCSKARHIIDFSLDDGLACGAAESH
jgi:hypothetical protein